MIKPVRLEKKTIPLVAGLAKASVMIVAWWLCALAYATIITLAVRGHVICCRVEPCVMEQLITALPDIR